MDLEYCDARGAIVRVERLLQRLCCLTGVAITAPTKHSAVSLQCAYQTIADGSHVDAVLSRYQRDRRGRRLHRVTDRSSRQRRASRDHTHEARNHLWGRLKKRVQRGPGKADEIRVANRTYRRGSRHAGQQAELANGLTRCNLADDSLRPVTLGRGAEPPPKHKAGAVGCFSLVKDDLAGMDPQPLDLRGQRFESVWRQRGEQLETR